MTEQPHPPIVSPDGRHVWDGQRWQPREQVVSPDGREIWDGQRWQPREPPTNLASKEDHQQVNADGEWEPLDDWAVGPPSSEAGKGERLTMQELIRHRVAQGYRVVSQTERTAQLVKPKSFNALVFVILLLLCLFPAVVYIAMYAAEKDRTFYLEVDDKGTLRQNGSVASLSPAESRPSGVALVVTVGFGVLAAIEFLRWLTGGYGAGTLVVAAILGGIAVAIWRRSAANG